MPRSYLIFGDIDGKLGVLRVECTKCARKGRYSVRKLIEKYGRRGNMMKWREQLNGDCPRRDAHSPHERCARGLGQLGDGTDDAGPLFDRKLLSQGSFDVRNGTDEANTR